MTDPKYIPNTDEKIEIDAIQEGMRRSEKIHEMTEKVEDQGIRATADSDLDGELGEEGVV